MSSCGSLKYRTGVVEWCCYILASSLAANCSDRACLAIVVLVIIIVYYTQCGVQTVVWQSE